MNFSWEVQVWAGVKWLTFLTESLRSREFMYMPMRLEFMRKKEMVTRTGCYDTVAT